MSNSVNTKYRDRLFCFIFGKNENRKWTLSLYNAINNTDYKDPDAIEINTLDDTVYMGMKNDVSFILDSVVSLYEQQSTYNPNMPIRQLIYLSKMYESYINETDQNMYGRSRVILPVPKLVTLYNGKDDISDHILKLSDLFPEDADISASDVEITVHMINVRPDYNKELLDKCKPLYEYSWLVEKVMNYAENIGNTHKDKKLEIAVYAAIKEMPNGFEIKKYLVKNRIEVKDMLITEYDEAKTLAMTYRDGKNEGRIEGIAEGISEGKNNLLIHLICKKLRRKMDVSEIAREVEEDEDRVMLICDIAEHFAPDYDEDKVFEAFLKKCSRS